jgi:integrase
VAYGYSLNHFGQVVQSKCVHEITAATLQDFVVRRSKKVKQPTINKDLRAIRASLKWAAERGYITKCPSFKNVFVRQDVKKPVTISRHCRDAMFVALDNPELGLRVRDADWWRVFLTVVAELGVRRGEALGLAWGAVDFREREITIYSETSKGRRDRTLPISDDLLVCLRTWSKKCGPCAAEDLVLPWPKRSYRAFYDDWARIVAAAGLPAGFKPSPKNFRSTCGTELVQAGVSTFVVKDFLGHASVTTTEAFYVNTGSSLRPAIEKRTAAFTGEQVPSEERVRDLEAKLAAQDSVIADLKSLLGDLRQLAARHSRAPDVSE